MKRFILNQTPDADGTIRLLGDDYHYLVRVRRLAPGEFFPALLPSGAETLIKICSVEGGILRGECHVTVDAQGPVCDVPPPIVLFQALPKGEKMDMIVRQAAEGGLAEIVPFVSEFSISKISGEAKSRSKTARWERIIKEARQQSGSAIATAVRQPLSMDELFAYWEELKNRQPKALGLLFHHLPLAQVSLHEYLDSVPEMAALAIGPEGGFSSAEVSRFLEAGFKPLTIGNTVLRTETAALYGAAAIRTILLERDSWELKQRQPVNG
ncbi:MAG: 16S rRNA (uracil(1498)-N(3))-methyltransferase [Treponema sp.]|jgi:16S rRNA (uracil1498-N3)-methyltransferase|nr:16S rRNA (uracil(1498)-N(3))-methyltransferase [Treponema sp.]